MNELRQKMFELNIQLEELRGQKAEVQEQENREILEWGLEKFSDDRQFRDDLRLIGQDFHYFGKWNRNIEKDSNIERYNTLCNAFGEALENLKAFYGMNKHLSIVDDLINADENGNQHANRDLVAVFKQARNKKDAMMGR